MGRSDVQIDLATGMPMPRNKIPLAVKLVYTSFAAVMVPIYWRDYGPQNFLYFCDVAVLTTLVALWLESSFLISMQAVAILLPQTIWVIDFLGHFANLHLLGMTDYMFDSNRSLFLRGISLFHGWLPFLIVWMLVRLGYDKRAFVPQIFVGLALLAICYFGFAPPPAPAHSPNLAVNINYVYGLSDNAPQTTMPPLAWLGMLMVIFPVGIYWPTHLVLSRVFDQREALPDVPEVMAA